MIFLLLHFGVLFTCAFEFTHAFPRATHSKLFATPLSHMAPSNESPAGRLRLMKDLRHSIEELSATTPSDDVSNRGGWQSLDKHILRPQVFPGVEVAFKLIKEAVEEHLRGHVHSIQKYHLGGTAYVSMVSSWANVNQPGAWNAPHVHPGCDLSGILYVACGETESNYGENCALNLIDPRPGTALGMDGNNYGASFGLGQDMNLRNLGAGDVLLFPNFLSHYVEPHAPKDSNDYRISISFNLKINVESSPSSLRVVFTDDRHHKASSRRQQPHLGTSPDGVYSSDRGSAGGSIDERYAGGRGGVEPRQNSG